MGSGSSPSCTCTFKRTLESEDTSLGFSLVTHIRVFLPHSYHHTLEEEEEGEAEEEEEEGRGERRREEEEEEEEGEKDEADKRGGGGGEGGGEGGGDKTQVRAANLIPWLASSIHKRPHPPDVGVVPLA